jgi:aldehyde dehydrogenase (NAD+)
VDSLAGWLEAGEGGAGRVLPTGPGVLDYTLREPWGVCALVLGSARPLRAATRSVLPALAAGNAVIVKPSELASIGLLRLAELAERAGVPRGMLHVATGDAATGAALAGDAGVDHVTFAGSLATGREVAAACAARGVPALLAPTGTGVQIAFADADVERAVAGAVAALLDGECDGVRLLLARAIHDEVVVRLMAAIGALRVGPGAEDLDLGPLISEERLARVQATLAAARGDGATVVGGEPLSGLLMRPALVTGAGARLSGPVLGALAFDEEWEGVAAAGSAPSAVVWTRDLSRAHRVAAHLRAERVGVNGAPPPTGGRLDAYSRARRVSVTL